jgi:hypothetical protein
MTTSTEKATGLGADFQSSLELNVARPPSPASADSATNRVGTNAESCPERTRSVRPTTDRVGRTLLSDSADTIAKPAQTPPQKPDISAALNSGAASNLHCPHPLPSGF